MTDKLVELVADEIIASEKVTVFDYSCAVSLAEILIPIIRKEERERIIDYIEKYVYYVDSRGYIALKPDATKKWQALKGEGK